MGTVRRLYFAIISATSLAMLVVGVAAVGGILLEWWLSPGAIERSLRESLAAAGAAALVGLPIWAVHWAAAQRFARDPRERASAIRRLYLYFVLGPLAIGAGFLGADLFQQLVAALVGSRAFDPVGVGRRAWELALTAAFWAYHFRVAAADRDVVGERGASATLRRWYAYVVQTIALAAVLFGARELLTILAGRAIESPAVGASGVEPSAGAVVAFGALWVFHRRWSSHGPVGEDDRASTLRAVAGFGMLALSVSLALAEASRVLYYSLARALGVASPGGVTGDLPSIIVGPASTIVVFGGSWLLLRHLLMRDAGDAEAPRQAGVRRLYAHLVATVSLAALATGVAGLLWTMADQAFGAASPADAWRDQISLFITLVVVGLPVWLGHWRPAPSAPARLALSRRLYVFAALLAGVLAVLGSGAYLVYRGLNVILGGTGELSASELTRASSIAVVAALVVAYHFRVLREDRVLPLPQGPLGEGEGAVADLPAAASLPPLVVEILGVSESDLRTTLARLPSSARYTIHAQD